MATPHPPQIIECYSTVNITNPSTSSTGNFICTRITSNLKNDKRKNCPYKNAGRGTIGKRLVHQIVVRSCEWMKDTHLSIQPLTMVH